MPGENEKTVLEKLAVLLPHFISHNEEHAAELEKWAVRSEGEGGGQVALDLRRAAKHMKQSGLNSPTKKHLFPESHHSHNHDHD
jgi:hypothetical protein